MQQQQPPEAASRPSLTTSWPPSARQSTRRAAEAPPTQSSARRGLEKNLARSSSACWAWLNCKDRIASSSHLKGQIITLPPSPMPNCMPQLQHVTTAPTLRLPESSSTSAAPSERSHSAVFSNSGSGDTTAMARRRSRWHSCALGGWAGWVGLCVAAAHASLAAVERCCTTAQPTGAVLNPSAIEQETSPACLPAPPAGPRWSWRRSG